MAAVSIDCKLFSSHVNGHSLKIEYPPSVLAEINTSVIDGFNRFRRGGIEVGGVLFGSYQDDKVRILAFRPLDCEHSFGPNFLLSDRDRLALDELLKQPLADPKLRGLIPIGWYRSRTRKGIHLSPEDMEIFKRYFPEPWQVTLVLHPEPFVPTKAGFFFREAGGAIRTESSYSEFSVLQTQEPRLEQAQAAPPIESPEQLFPVPTIPSMAQSSISLEQPVTNFGDHLKIKTSVELPQKPPARATSVPANKLPDKPIESPIFEEPSARIPSTIKSIVYATVLGLILASVYFGIARNTRLAPNQTSLIVEDRGGKLWIGWDPKRWDSAVGAARLEIHDGDHTSFVDLSKEQLRSGSVTYARQSDNVWVRMQAENTEEWVAFIGPASYPPEPPPPVEKDAGRQQIDQQAQEIRRLQQVVQNFNRKEMSRPARREVRPFLAPRKEFKMATIPSLEAPPAERTGSPLAAPVLIGNLTPSAPISAPGRDPTPRTGTMIWTGRLNRTSILTIEGNRSSAGAVTGAVPGFPVRLSVHPAELTEEGLTIFTSDAKYADGYREPAGPTNGWNRTRYLRDLTRAKAVAILEFPSSANEWKRLVLRNDQSTLSVVIIEWAKLSAD